MSGSSIVIGEEIRIFVFKYACNLEHKCINMLACGKNFTWLSSSPVEQNTLSATFETPRLLFCENTVKSSLTEEFLLFLPITVLPGSSLR